MFLPHTIGDGGKSATKRRGRVPCRTGAGEKPDSGSRGTHRRRFRDTLANQTWNSNERCSRLLCV